MLGNNMKHVQLYEQFVTEKAYQLTGIYGAKGIIGKVLFAFKKEIERIKYEGDADSTLAELNDVWTKWADKDGAKIIEQEVMRVVNNKEAIVYIVATLSKAQWIADVVNRLNTPTGTELFVSLNHDFVINVGFADDVDGNKFSRKLDGMTNTAIPVDITEIVGSFDSAIGYNNVEIRKNIFLSIDAK
jgi:hypothetical protein